METRSPEHSRAMIAILGAQFSGMTVVGAGAALGMADSIDSGRESEQSTSEDEDEEVDRSRFLSVAMPTMGRRSRQNSILELSL